MSCECVHPQLPHRNDGGFVCEKCGCMELVDADITDRTGGKVMVCKNCWRDYIRIHYEEQFGRPKEAAA